jgi:hypothetical protein
MPRRSETANGRNGDRAKRKADFTRRGGLYRIAQGFSPGACRICDGVKSRFHIQSDGGWLDRLLKFRFADQIIKKLKANQPRVGLRALQELVAGGCFWEQLA